MFYRELDNIKKFKEVKEVIEVVKGGKHKLANG